jgi:dTDP-D-glucose 4,6-dehydratase
MKILIRLGVLSIMLIIFRERLLTFMGDFLIIRDTLQPADVIHVIAGERHGDIYLTYFHCSKAYRELGWEPEVSFEKGLHLTVNYFKDWLVSLDAKQILSHF